jgi:hypothetical protein
LCPTDEAGAQRVPLDVSTDANELTRFLNQMRFESALVDRPFADSLPLQAKPHRMGSRYPVKEA